jgi:Zn-dependent M28 family amino/carboxypeptidase
MRAVSSVLLLLLLAGCGPTPPTPAVSKAFPPPIPFGPADGSNALARVAALCRLGPRDAGTPGGVQAADWIAAQLQAEGLHPRIDTFTNATPAGPLVCRNVLAELPVSHITMCDNKAAADGAGSRTFLLLSHFDTKSGISSNFVGANDGGSSTALLLELAHALQRTPLRGTRVLLGFLDGEECRVEYGPHDGFHGSRRLAAQCAAEKRPLHAVILLDMIGDRDLTVMLPANGTPALSQLVFDAATAVGARRCFQLADGRILDDHQAFLDAGYPAIDLIDFRYGSSPGANDYWHTAEDTPDKLSAESLTTVGQVVLEMLRRLAAE